MGAGRKTFSYDVDTRNESNYRFEQQQRNLGDNLGAVIFSERRRPEQPSAAIMQHRATHMHAPLTPHHTPIAAAPPPQCATTAPTAPAWTR